MLAKKQLDVNVRRRYYLRTADLFIKNTMIISEETPQLKKWEQCKWVSFKPKNRRKLKLNILVYDAKTQRTPIQKNKQHVEQV